MSDQIFADPFDELYASRSEAYAAGKYFGSAETISWARQELSKLSVKHEPADDPAKFHAVEECCAVLRKIAEMIEVERERSKIGQH
jgi:hypothetical protein